MHKVSPVVVPQAASRIVQDLLIRRHECNRVAEQSGDYDLQIFIGDKHLSCKFLFQ